LVPVPARKKILVPVPVKKNSGSGQKNKFGPGTTLPISTALISTSPAGDAAFLT